MPLYTSVSWHAAAFRAFIPASNEQNTSLLGAGYLTVKLLCRAGRGFVTHERKEGRALKKPCVIAVCGVKNSGKTTLIERLIPEICAAGLKVAVIKHDGHDFEADVPGTDSYRHFAAGAYGVAVYSSQKMSIVREDRSVTVEKLIPFFPEADLILCEGQKYSALPKLEPVRGEIACAPVCRGPEVLAYISDMGMERFSENPGTVVYSLTEIDKIVQLIVRYCRTCI